MLDTSYLGATTPVLIAYANFNNGNLQPTSIVSGINWNHYSNGSAALSIEGNSIKGICPASNGSNHVNVLGLGVSVLQTRSVFIKFRAKFRGRPHAIKFCKVHGMRATEFPGGTVEIPDPHGEANCTFGLGPYGNMVNTSYGDGSTTGNDTANIIVLAGAPHQLGRAQGLATVDTPQNSAFTEAMWGDDEWHEFRVHVKFNSGTSSEDEVNDGVFYVEIDGQIYVYARGIYNRHYSNLPIDYISFFDVAQDNDYGYELLYDDIQISTGNFMDTVPGKLIQLRDGTVSGNPLISNGTSVEIIAYRDGSPDIVTSYTVLVTVDGWIKVTDPTWVVGDIKNVVIRIGTLSQAFSFVAEEV